MLNLEDDTFGAAGIQSGKVLKRPGHWNWKFSALAGQFSWSLRNPFESGDLAFFALTQ